MGKKEWDEVIDNITLNCTCGNGGFRAYNVDGTAIFICVRCYLTYNDYGLLSKSPLKFATLSEDQRIRIGKIIDRVKGVKAEVKESTVFSSEPCGHCGHKEEYHNCILDESNVPSCRGLDGNVVCMCGGFEPASEIMKNMKVGSS